MHAQDGLAAGEIRVGHRDLAVEAARAQQRRIQDVRAVGGGDEDDALAVAEAVHFHQQLVECLLALVVPAAGAGAALAAHRVDLIDEDDARAVFLRLLEQVAHAGRAHADEHLHEVGTGDGIKRHARLAGHGAGQQRLAGTRRAVEQHAARDLRAELEVPGRILKEVLDLHEFVNGFIGTRDVVEGVGRLVLGELLGFVAADAEQSAGALLHAGDEEEEQGGHGHHRQEQARHLDQEVVLGHVGLVGVDAGVFHGVEDLRRGACRVLGVDLLDVVALLDGRRLAQFQPKLLLAIVDLGFLDVVVIELLQRHRRVHPHEVAGVVGEEGEGVERHQHEGSDPAVAEDLLVFH